MECIGKRKFNTISQTHIRAREINTENRNNKDKTYLRPYKCSQCKGFHLSSESKEKYKHKVKLKNPKYRAEVRTKRNIKLE